MRRYLLFDGHCEECSRIAQAVREHANGRIEPKSLHDPAMRTMVDRVRPGGKPEPLLLEVEGDAVRVRSGLSMRLRLLRVLGPGRAFRMAERIIAGEVEARDRGPAETGGLARRGVLAKIASVAVVSGGVLVGVGATSGAAHADTRGQWVTDKAILDRLRRTKVARAATSAYGTPRWEQVYQGGADKTPHYVLTHPGALGKPDTFTVVQDPSTVGEDALGFSFLVRSIAGLPRIDWLRPDGGDRVMRTDVHGDGSSTSSTEDGRWARVDMDGKRTGPLADFGKLFGGRFGADALVADQAKAKPTDPSAWVGFFLCLASCAGPHIPACGGFCASCGASGGANPVSCTQCAGCVAGVALGCGMTCWPKFPIKISDLGPVR